MCRCDRKTIRSMFCMNCIIFLNLSTNRPIGGLICYTCSIEYIESIFEYFGKKFSFKSSKKPQNS